MSNKSVTRAACGASNTTQEQINAMPKHVAQTNQSLGVSADVLAAERAHIRAIQTRGMARVLERVSESQRFAATRKQDVPVLGRWRVARYTAATATGLAAGLLTLFAFEFWMPTPRSGSVIVTQADPGDIRVDARLAAARHTRVVESAIDRAQPGSTLLVPAGTRLEGAEASMRIAKPLRIDTPS